MAFDRNNPAHLLALKNEVNNDPLTLGYDPGVTQSGVLDIVNDPSLGGQTGADFVTAELLLDAIFTESISSQDQFKIQLLFEGSDSFQDDLSRFKSRIAALSPGLATALDGIVRPLSRAEVLFSNDNEHGVKEIVVITRDDWIAARDS